MKTVNVWDIQIWDGGDRCNHAFYLSSNEEAEKWKVNNKFDNVQEQTFKIYDTIEEYREGKSEVTRQRALAKLTPIERISLGLE